MIYFNHVKQTDFRLEFVLVDTDEDGNETNVDLSQTDVDAQLRREDGTLVDTLSVDLFNAANGQFRVTADVPSQANWPVGKLVCRVRFSAVPNTFPGPPFDARSSQQFAVFVEPAITEV